MSEVTSSLGKEKYDLVNFWLLDYGRSFNCDGQEKQERKLSLLVWFLIFNCFSNSIGLT